MGADYFGGLLGGGQQQIPQQFGGLLDAVTAVPTGQGAGMQLAMQLSQTPTAQTARSIIRQLHQMKSPEASQFEQLLMQIGDNPAGLKQAADAVIQKLSGGRQ